MSVVINTNGAATVAANNLAASSTALQKSLNRLSSGSKIVNPADDAGGLAVSMKLSAAARRQAAVATNIANAASLLQTQDGVLSVTGKLLNRISELKVLNNDVTKSSSDRANYNAEFKALQAQITANADEKFNGVALFGTTDLSVGVTEDGKTAVTAQAIDLLGTGVTSILAPYTDPLNDLSQWSASNGGATASNGTMTLVLDTVRGSQTFTGAFEINFDYQANIATAPGRLMMSFVDVASKSLGTIIPPDTASNHVRIAFDGAGSAAVYYSDPNTPDAVVSGVPTSGQLRLQNVSISHITNFVTDFLVPTTVAGSRTDAGLVADATDLSSVGLSTITGAIEDIATARAQNGATQSRLGFASELVTVNQANLEAANSRITDVDVAQESTVLARYNVLVSAGTSMLAQANQSAQMALKLLG